uniref:Uncharacterized protein n=1 Tax=Nelumbo nucifera TaxID=4432 RepID=A0A822ZGY5_NELNU|nr:TPA_asm: hypothetical protein HUJ06_000516 [Nelumbo nucifera]
MHKSGKVHDRCWNPPCDLIIGDVQDGEVLELAYTRRNTARELVTNEIEDSEVWYRSDASRNRAGDSFPVGNNKVGESVELTDCRRDSSGHVTGPPCFLEDGVAVNAVPVVATVGSFPRVEDAQVRLVECSFEGEKSCPV